MNELIKMEKTDEIKKNEEIKETFEKLTNEDYFKICIAAMEANTTTGAYVLENNIY